MENPIEMLRFLVSHDWQKPAPTAIAAGALLSSLLAGQAVSSDSWKAIWIIVGSMGLSFLVVPRIFAVCRWVKARANSERDREARREAEDEAKREAFHALAPRIATLLLHADGRADSVLQKDGPAREDGLDLLMRLRGEFQIDTYEPDPGWVAIVEPYRQYLCKIGEYAYGKNLQAAQKLKAPPPF